MLILEAHNIKKFFGEREIFSFDELKIQSGDKIGIVGQNGAGKTTLLNVLSGDLLPDEGTVRHFCDIAYIRQFSEERIIADSKVLSEFEVKDKIGNSTVSGGEMTRLKIAGALSKNNILLFADEPTSNLDFKGVQLLKQKLDLAESLVLISHDRELLDSICNKIIEVSDGKLTFYNGNYSFFKHQKQKKLEREWFEFDSYITEKKHLEDAIINRKARAKSIRKAPKRMGNSEARLHKRSAFEISEKLHNAAKSIETRLEKLEVKNKPKENPGIKLDFSLTNPPQNKIVISATNFSFSYVNESTKTEIFKNTKFQIYNGLKQAVVGDNGAGKTTLLNQIYQSYKQDKGNNDINVVPKAVFGYFYQGFENLDLQKTVLENVMRESVQKETTARTILARLLISGDSVYKKAEVLSGGERIKVAFAKLFVSNANVLLLDEPTNYLDMASIEALQNILCEYEGTFIFVSHDKAFINAVANRLIIVKNKEITEFEGNLNDYEDKNSIPKVNKNRETDKLLLQMRMTEVLAKLSIANLSSIEKDKLELEYQSLVSELKNNC